MSVSAKQLLLLCALCATVFAAHYQGYGGDGGHNDHYEDKKYPYQPYGFGYDVEDGHGNKQWRHEKSNEPMHVIGSYGYKDKHGIVREVDYVADKHGFRAHVRTNEPGTAPKDPAAVKMDAQPVQVTNHGSDHGYGGGYGGGHGGGGHGGGDGYGDVYSGHASQLVRRYKPIYSDSIYPAAESRPRIAVIPISSFETI